MWTVITLLPTHWVRDVDVLLYYVRTDYETWTVACPVIYGLSTKCGNTLYCFLCSEYSMWSVVSSVTYGLSTEYGQ